MKTNNIVLLTFDFEMFLGRSGTVCNCLTKPVNALLEVFKELNIRATFFVDATFVHFLKQNGLTKEYGEVSMCIQKLLRAGNRIELHIHPQWYDAKYEEKTNEFTFPQFRYYTLRACPNEIRTSMFEDSLQDLLEICCTVDDNYKIKGYRAGGWCIDDFKDIEPYFKKYNIKFDSSVLPHCSKGGTIQSFDYKDIPVGIDYYYFQEDVRHVMDKGYLEVPVSVYKATPLVKISRILGRKLNPDSTIPFGDGHSIDKFGTEAVRHNLKFIVRKLFSKQYEFCSIDGYCNANNLANLVSTRPITTIVGHPKSLTKKSIKAIRRISATGCKFLTISEYFNL